MMTCVIVYLVTRRIKGQTSVGYVKIFLPFLQLVFSPDSVGTQFVIFGIMGSSTGDVALLPSISNRGAAAEWQDRSSVIVNEH